VAENANGQQVLDAAADLRLDKGIVCGIDGYPASTCSVTVKNAPAPATEQAVDFTLPASEASAQAASDGGGSDQAASDEGGVPWPLVGVAVAVLVLGGGALALSRRNRNA
jgi:hypothetical protein